MMIISLLIPAVVPFTGQAGSIHSQTRISYDLVFNGTCVIDVGTNVTWENQQVSCEYGLNNSGTLLIMNSTVNMGDSFIHNTGWINMVNSTILVGGPGMFNQGYLNMTDLDGDQGTAEDGSLLIGTRNSSSGEYPLMQMVINLRSTLNATRSRIDGLRLSAGNQFLKELTMRNSTIIRPNWGSSLGSMEMYGNGSATAIECFHSISLTDIHITDYEKGVVLKGPKTYTHLVISNCGTGIEVGSTGTTLEDSILTNNTIQIISSANLTIIDTEVKNGQIYLSTTGTSTIHGSSFLNMTSIEGLSRGVVRDSEFTGCTIALERPFNSIITRNRFTWNQKAVEEGEDCIFFHNSFIGNKMIVTGPLLSTWYNENLTEGNYYDIYMGKDDGSKGRPCGDGVGDTDIPFLARDPYPLLQDMYWDMPTIPVLEVRYQQGSDRVDLSWEAGGTRYIVQRSTSEDFSTRLVSWSTADAALSVHNNENTTLYFRVRVYNTIGSKGWSMTKKVEVNQFPLPPSVIWLDPVPEGKAMKVSWKWDGEDLYRALIYYGHGLSDSSVVGVYYPESSVVIDNLMNELEYSFIIITMDHSGLTSESTMVMKGVPRDTVPPPPPRGLIARTRTNASIALEWSPPLTQDLWGYVIYRRDPGSMEFHELTRLSKSVLYYEDRGLSDNTTYEYAMATIDDDGPISVLSEIVSNTTAHNNQRPIFIGSELIIYMVEDEGPSNSRILEHFLDPDGDPLVFSIVEYFPFYAMIAEGLLWVVPEPDQAGEGYVQIGVFDGEEYSYYLIGVLVEPVEDPPRNVRIISPVNGSIILPGTMVVLEASGYDPDVDNGDVLNVTWTSDRDGQLQISTQSIMRTVRELGPGKHLISITVEDKAGNVARDSVEVMVSLWGWGEVPWRVAFSDPERRIDLTDPYLEITINNDSPLVLRFHIQGEIGGISLSGERNVLIGPMSSGNIALEVPTGLDPDDELLVGLAIEVQTLNGTYGGTMEISDVYRVVSGNDTGSTEAWMVIIIIAVSILALIGISSYTIISLKTRNDRKGD